MTDTAEDKAPCIDHSLVARAEEAMKEVRARGLSLVTAESCTAGLIAAVLSQTEGASDCLHGGFVTYTKEQKTKALGVSASLLAARGSVNEEVAAAMAKGALARSGAAIALAVTGVLGPSEDEDGNPVGLIFFALAARDRTVTVAEKRFAPLHHEALRHAAVMQAFALIEQAAKEA